MYRYFFLYQSLDMTLLITLVKSLLISIEYSFIQVFSSYRLVEKLHIVTITLCFLSILTFDLYVCIYVCMYIYTFLLLCVWISKAWKVSLSVLKLLNTRCILKGWLPVWLEVEDKDEANTINSTFTIRILSQEPKEPVLKLANTPNSKKSQLSFDGCFDYDVRLPWE